MLVYRHSPHRVKPEEERHVEFGIKTGPFAGATVNLTLFNTDIDDYQAQVVNGSVGVLRGMCRVAGRASYRWCDPARRVASAQVVFLL